MYAPTDEAYPDGKVTSAPLPFSVNLAASLFHALIVDEANKNVGAFLPPI